MLDFGYRPHATAFAETPKPRRRDYHPNLERLICAAVSNARLAELLIQAPMRALAQYEVGRFLTAAERRLVSKINDAQDIYEFAGRLHALVTALHRMDTEHQVFERDEEAAHHEQNTVQSKFRPVSATAPASVLAQLR